MTPTSDAGVARTRTKPFCVMAQVAQPVRLIVRKPIVRHFVMRVLWIEERDKQIDVEERHAAHSSSLSSFTSFIVIIRPPGRRGSNGTPLRTFGAGPLGVSALRARLESIFPVVTRVHIREFFGGLKHILV